MNVQSWNENSSNAGETATQTANNNIIGKNPECSPQPSAAMGCNPKQCVFQKAGNIHTLLS